MTVGIIRHRVRDFAEYRKAFLDHAPLRKAAGCKGSRLMQMEDNPNNVVVILEFNTLANFQDFGDNPELQQYMEAAGVLESPRVYALTDGELFPL